MAFDRQDFDCPNYPNPIQVLRISGTYYVKELDIDTGSYNEVFDLSWLGSSHTNAAAMLTVDRNNGRRHYVFGAFGDESCAASRKARDFRASLVLVASSNVTR